MKWLAVIAVAACQPGASTTTRPAPPAQLYLLTDLVGGWRWQLRTSADSVTRIEREAWRFRPAPGAPTQLAGRYLREVEFRSEDRLPFACNQRPWYRQRALYDVSVSISGTGYAVRETDYHAEPSPCDHGFRRLADYTGDAAGARFKLSWDGGSQTLWQTDSELVDLPAAPWSEAPDLTGPWRWDATTRDDAGDLRDESEWWEITRRSDTRIDATYRRRVTIRSADGASIACAGAPEWSFDDAYVLDGQREEEHWHFYERAADAGEHPCLVATPRRNLDEATVEEIGDYLVLEWRGKRHQILYRPD